MDLSLDIANRDVDTLERALARFTEEETLDGDNAVTCARCQAKRAVTKGLRLATAPTMLVINYKRFAYDVRGRLSRLSKAVRFPLRLEIGPYMSRANRGTPPPYALVAVLVHRGRSCDCGHYFAYVRKGRDWYRADDAEVSRVAVAEVLRAQAYVLVYEVEGMKEKHNFDCYSRYHRSLDEAEGADGEVEGAGDTGGPRSPSAWDFSSLTGLLEACDAGLCGSIANVMDAAGEHGDHRPGSPPPPYDVPEGDNSLEEEDSPARPRRPSAAAPSPPRAPRRVATDGRDTGDDPNVRTLDRDDAVKKYYKRGRSHTPSREHRGRENHQVDLNASLHYRKRERDVALGGARDYEPPKGVRRAKSLSRVEKFKKMEKGGGGGSGSGHVSAEGAQRSRGAARRRGPSRPRDRRVLPPTAGQVVVVLPPLHEPRGGSGSRRGVLL